MTVLIWLLISAGLATLSLLGVAKLSQFSAITNMAIGLGAWFVWLVLVITPVKMWREKAKIVAELTTKRLTVPQAEVYDDGKGQHWLRLRVENPTGLTIRDCYGKSLSYRLVNYPLISEGQSIRQPVSLERGQQRSKTAQLPPDKHPFTWSPIELPPTLMTIPGHGSHEFLYIVAKRKGSSSFGTPTDMGVKYDNCGLGDFELILEIGSETEAFPATKVRVVFRITGDKIQTCKLDTLN